MSYQRYRPNPNRIYYTWLGLKVNNTTPLKNTSGAVRILPSGQLVFGIGNLLRS